MENPPQSVAEIRLCLSLYLDGALDEDQIVDLEQRIARDEIYQQELAKLQAARQAMQASLHKQAEQAELPGSLWQNIAAQLQTDSQNEAQACQPEFISAYYDGEIPASDPELQAFERQLYHNPEANRLLAGMGAVSDAVHQFGYRLEEACTLDISQQVMAAFMAEEGLSPVTQAASQTSEEPADPTAELVSAFFDQELSGKDSIEANRLIENNPQAHRMLADFNRVSEGIQAVSEQIQAQAPDLWPAIQETVATDLAADKIASLAEARKRRGWLRVALPTAAAAILVVLALPAMQVSPPSVESADGNLGMGAFFQQERSQLASVPGAMGGGLVDEQGVPMNAPRVENVLYRPDSPRTSYVDEAASPPLTPILEKPGTAGNRQMANSAVPMEGRQHTHQHTPSSEEYLFKALSEQMSAEDISNILGP